MNSSDADSFGRYRVSLDVVVECAADAAAGVVGLLLPSWLQQSAICALGAVTQVTCPDENDVAYLGESEVYDGEDFPVLLTG